MRVENNNKAFAYMIYSHFTQQCKSNRTEVHQNLKCAVQWSKASRVTPIIMVTLVVLTTEKPSTVLALGSTI